MRTHEDKNMTEFDSITQMASWAVDNVPGFNRRDEVHKFYGKTSWDEMIGRCAFGDEANVPQAMKMLGQLETQFESSAPVFTPSVSGCFPSVPEYLVGEPECMFDEVTSDTNNAPLSIYIDMTTSQDFTATQYRKRGLATLALAIALSQVRPISLHLCTVMDCDETYRKDGELYSIVTCRVETAPLDLARAAFALTDVAVPRRLFYSASARLHGFTGKWPTFNGCTYGRTLTEEHLNRVRELIGMENDVLYIPPVSISHGESQMMVDYPVDWINEKLALYGMRRD